VPPDPTPGNVPALPPRSIRILPQRIYVCRMLRSLPAPRGVLANATPRRFPLRLMAPALGVGYRCSPLPIGPLLRKHARCLIVTLFPLLSGECKPMSLDNSPEPLWLPRKVPKRVPENPVLLLFGRGSRFGEPPTDPSINSMRGDMPAARYQQVERCCNTG